MVLAGKNLVHNSLLYLFLFKQQISILHVKSSRKSIRGDVMMVYSCGWSRVLFLYIVGCLDCAGLDPPALAACDASVLSCSFSQVLVHCSPEFSQTCCIDIPGLCLIPITALPFLLPPSETCSVQEKMALSVLL